MSLNFFFYVNKKFVKVEDLIKNHTSQYHKWLINSVFRYSYRYHTVYWNQKFEESRIKTIYDVFCLTLWWVIERFQFWSNNLLNYVRKGVFWMRQSLSNYNPVLIFWRTFFFGFKEFLYFNFSSSRMRTNDLLDVRKNYFKLLIDFVIASKLRWNIVRLL